MTARLATSAGTKTKNSAGASNNGKPATSLDIVVKKCGAPSKTATVAASSAAALSSSGGGGGGLAAGASPIARSATSTTATADGRRANKPLMEKRRRARINQSLAVLKTLILDSARLENTKHSKLEKADILELTVRHLQRQRALGSAVLNKYRAGFQECTREVSRFLESSDLMLTPGTPSLDPTVKQRLLRHLDSCVAELDLDFGLAGGGVASSATTTTASTTVDGVEPVLVKAEADSEARPDSSTNTTTAGGDENNNSHPTTAHGLLSRPSSSLEGKMTPQSSGTAAASPSPEPTPDMMDNDPLATSPTPSSSSSMLSVVQVIPSRLPDGQVVFLLPSHYVQLAAAAASSSSTSSPAPTGPTTGTATFWTTGPATSTTNDRESSPLLASKLCRNEPVDPLLILHQSPEDDDQPIDFTMSNKRKLEPEDDEDMVMGDVRNDIKEEPVWRPW